MGPKSLILQIPSLLPRNPSIQRRGFTRVGMEFRRRKAAAVADMNSQAPDKSPKGTIDTPIIPLLNAINSHPSYFTTSSCSGRISILSQPTTSPSAIKKKSGGGFWFFVSHDAVQPSALSTLLFPSAEKAAERVDPGEEIRAGESLVFRFEPLIIAVECENVEAAQSLVSAAISCGFRESGITNARKRVIIAIRCSIRLEVPLGNRQMLMVSPEYLEYLVEVANEKMDANRKRADLFLSKLISSGFTAHGIRGNGEMSGNGGETCIKADNVGYPGNSTEDGVEVREAELGTESKLYQDQDDGMVEEIDIHLSAVEVVGEPIERLFLWGHSSCALNHWKIIIFGGFGGIGQHARRNDLLLLDMCSQRIEVIAVTGAPSPRLGHTCSIVGDYIYVIGGRAGLMDILNEVWIFNNKKKEWKLLQCSGCFFPPRHRHTAVVGGSKIYVYGGINSNAVLSTLYILDTNTSEWSEIETKEDQPGPRHSHSMDAKGSKLYMFGGHNGEKALGNLYCFDIHTGLWSNLKTYGQSPNARFSHLMFIHSNFLSILGGCPVDEFQEMFLLDLQALSWKRTMIKSVGGLFVRSTANVIGNALIIIGGGASCYAFGTKFSEPMKIDLHQLVVLGKNKAAKVIKAKRVQCQMQQKSVGNLVSSNKNEEKADTCGDVDPGFEEPSVSDAGLGLATPCILRLEKKYAKLGKDILKRFGWLDLQRKVYSQVEGMYICFPVTEKFCNVIEDKHKFGDRIEELTTLESLRPIIWQNMVKDMTCSVALDLLVAYGATKFVDEVTNLRKTPSSPHKVMTEAVATLICNHGLPSELLEQLPSRWERLGDIIVLPVGSFTDPRWESLGVELWPLVAQSLGTHRLARQGRIAQNGTRDSMLEILLGKDGWVDHRENGILYSFDSTKCMFSWGNLSEKRRMARLDCSGEVIVDLFAGIGYFVLPFLVRASAKMVYACEWNHHAIEALHRNLQLNHVVDRCVVLEGDNRNTAPKGVADRVCLGLLPLSEGSWITAVRALRDEGGRLHIHENVKDCEEDSWVNHVSKSISEIAKSEGRFWEISVEHVERVKWYGPHIRHLVVDLRCRSNER